MSLPVCTTVSGIDSMKVLRQNLKIALEFAPMSAGERQQYEQGLHTKAKKAGSSTGSRRRTSLSCSGFVTSCWL